jgi:uncharacterized damage-inducible protein DinB
MSLNKSILAELKMEAANTRKMLERVPISNAEWAPHTKSAKIGRLATHVADTPAWVTAILSADEFNIGKDKFGSGVAAASSTDELLAIHDNAIAGANQSLENATDEDFEKLWTLRAGDHVVFTLPKKAAIRTLALNHFIHHRGQLSVYLRLNDVPVPGMYGPSADERGRLIPGLPYSVFLVKRVLPLSF